MVVKIEQKHIENAEQILIGGNKFDNERKRFITNLDTCDLIAVPGSGKTTALIAKLYCLAKQMPFADSSGILVLAHTNNAVNEIEQKLKKYCPRLFEYPNFVGTIQSFVNKFLAIPYYKSSNQLNFKIVDDAQYNQEFDFYLEKERTGPIRYLNKNDPSKLYNARFNLDKNGGDIVIDKRKNKPFDVIPPEKWKKNGYADVNKNIILDFIKKTKKNIFTAGMLHYDDCYYYALKYLYECPKIKTFLQKRFKYVFIDEMQDLEKDQIKIIDSIFSEDSSTIIQRIGDPNQSIYNYNSGGGNFEWQPRSPIMCLNGSNRLTKEIADLVDCFILKKQLDLFDEDVQLKVNGLNKTNKQVIKPHLIVFDKSITGEALKDKFEEIIRAYNLHEDENAQKNGFKIIGWNAEWPPDEAKKNDKIRLKDLFPGFSKEAKTKKENFDCIKKYLVFDQSKLTLAEIRESILNVLLRILNLEEIKIIKTVKSKQIECHYTKNDLIEFIKNQGEHIYNSFKENLFKWCFNLVTKKEHKIIHAEIKNYIENKFIKYNWDNNKVKNIKKSIDFINKDHYFDTHRTMASTKNSEKHELKEITIEITTVHAVKGQTHCATMYVETAHGKLTYETEKLKKNKDSPLFKRPHHNYSSVAKQTLKMMYVGFSRPTHLLCFAALKENVENDITAFKNSGWEVIQLS